MTPPLAATDPHRRARRDAVAGALVWVAAIPWLPIDTAEGLLLLAALVVVPLGLALVPPDDGAWTAWTYRPLIPALGLPLSFAWSPGLVAALLVLPWLAFAGLVALRGLHRLRPGRSRSTPEVCTSAAMAFLAVGGAWLLATRAGWGPLGFAEPIVKLTAAHFHYAGFALTLLTGLALAGAPGWPARLTAAGVIVGVPLVAAGIVGGPAVEAWAGGPLVAATVALAVRQVRLAARGGFGRAGWLLGLSGAALFGGMALAAVYAVRVHLPEPPLDIPTMVRWHGVGNALGFAVPALVFWNRVGSPLGRRG
jgi:hypothetical protein